MMTRQQAIDAIKDLTDVEIEMTKRVNMGSGHISKGLSDREYRAIKKIFQGLTGSVIAMEEVRQITD